MKLFLPYQQAWIDDKATIKLMEKSRQIGITWATAYSLVKRQTHAANKLDAWVCSRDEVQAKLFLEDCKFFIEKENSDKAQENATSEEELSKPNNENQKDLSIQKSTSFSLRFANKTQIHALSSSANAQAGKRGTRILDEFALHPNPQKLYTIAYPGITWGGQLEIISTHRGNDNFFNRLVQEIKYGGNPKKISLHRVTLEDALNQGFLTKLKEHLPPNDSRHDMDDNTYFDFIRAGCTDNESFLQEYMCEPFDDASSFLSPTLIESNEYPENTAWQYSISKASSCDSEFYLGIDLGRDHDMTVFWLLENINNVFFTRKVLCLEKTPFATQETYLHQFLTIPSLRCACIDQTGIGRQFTERAIRRFGKCRVEGVTFTNISKEIMAFTLRSTMENHSLRIPSEKHILADLRSIKRQSTSTGKICFFANESKAGHADRFWALALAIHAAKRMTQSRYYSFKN